MSENGNKYALAALKNRRAELAGEIKQLKGQIDYRKEQLAHLDASIRILDPAFPVDTIPPKRPRRVKLFAAGELGRLILDTLRRAEGKPLSTPQIAQAIADAQGYNGDALVAVAHRVRANLAYLWKRRDLVTKTGDRLAARWALASD